MTDPFIALCPSDGEAHAGKKAAEDFMSVDREGGLYLRLPGLCYHYFGYALDENLANPGCLSPGCFSITVVAGLFPPFHDWTLGAHDRDVPDIRGKDGELHTVYRLREGIERFFITDINNPAGSTQAQSELPIMWDTASAGYAGLAEMAEEFNHVPGGSNVLFMDGHVEFVKFPSTTVWPLSSDAVNAVLW